MKHFSFVKSSGPLPSFHIHVAWFVEIALKAALIHLFVCLWFPSDCLFPFALNPLKQLENLSNNLALF